jgi:hypothetical protein
VIQTFDLAWKDIMILLDQTLSSLEKQWVQDQATQVGDNFHLQQSPIPVAPGNEEINMPIPMGAQTVPLADPHWNQNDEGDEWHQCHFFHLILEGIKRAKVKSLIYSGVTVVLQGPDENLLTFLQHLKEAIRKHTTVDPESQVGEVLLKNKFLAQSAQISVENSKSLG